MPPRQLWLFKLGCWITIGTAVLYLAGHLFGVQPPASLTERQLNDLAATYRFSPPVGAARSLVDVINGMSAASALLLATIGALGLLVERRAHDDAVLMAAVARALAVCSVVLLLISLTNLFVVQTLCIAMMAVCYLVASVEAPK